ncbi:MAG: hypothetical protein KC561_08560, partial [Myxococcales bacterium]|nr:hypothetical protein [Myxococcales bacterium]
MVALLLALLLPLSSQAQSGLEGQVESMLEESFDHYDMLELEEARDVLNQALVLGETADVDASLRARVLLMLGIVENALTGDDAVTVDRFVEGLLLDRDAELNVYYSNPDLEALLDEARDQLPPEAPPILMSHTSVQTADAGQPITLTATIVEGYGIRRVVLGYRIVGESRYRRNNMQLTSPTEFYATIPGSVTEPDTVIELEYYLEALDNEDGVIADAGTPNSPLRIVLMRDLEAPSDSSLDHLVSITLGAGSGVGLATGEPLVQGDNVDLNPGMAPTPLHVLIDLGFRFADVFELGPWARLQLVLLQDGIELEPLFGLKFKWLFATSESYRVFMSASAGYGHVRHTVDLGAAVDFVDTTQEGPFHVGAGLGYVLMFSDTVGLSTELFLMTLFDQVSVQLD